MVKIFYDKKHSILLPTSAEEINGRQLAAIAALLHSDFTKLKATLKALRVLANFSILKFYRLSNEVKLNCLEHVMWIFDEIKTTKNLLPHYKNYYGPADELNNMTLSEFHFTEKYYAEIKGEDLGALPHLIACLYRQAKPGYNKNLNIDGDARQTFNSNVVDYYARKIKKWPKGIQYAILIWYDACRKKIETDNPEIFTAGEGSDGDDLGMYGIMRGLAGPKFGDIEKVEAMLLHNALLELNLIKQEEIELKKKYK